MAQYKIEVNQRFNCSADKVFSVMSDHEQFGQVIGANIKRIQTGDDGANGKGSVRLIKVGPLPGFEETVTDFEDSKLIEYTISKGSPIKNHLGRIVFEENNGQTDINYTIVMESKIPFTTKIIAENLKIGLIKGLKKLSRKL